MEKFERICPKCGTANSYDRSFCSHCGATLTNLPVPVRPNLPSRVEGASAAALVVGAAALAARIGWQIFVRGVLPQITQALQERESRPIDVRSKRVPTEEEPDYVIRGWRAWSVRRGDEHSNGSENFEWRVKRNK